MKYEEWLADFVKGKKEVAVFPDSGSYLVHTVHRYLDQSNQVWETAFTYTDRLVVRSGSIQPDGVTAKWGDWNTLHDVTLPKATPPPAEAAKKRKSPR